MPNILSSPGDLGFYDDAYVPKVTENTYSLTNTPRINGVMINSMEYTNLSVGITDRIVLIGHADGLEINDPYQVVDIRATVGKLGANSSSPLLRGLLEAYYGGARDIWLVAAAPTSEYVEDLTERLVAADDGKNFYERYAERLAETYEQLETFDVFQIVAPLHAPIFGAGDVDFLLPLVDFCNKGFKRTGSVRIGLIGTALTTLIQSDVDDMIADPRIAQIPQSDGKMVMNIIGSGVFNLLEVQTAYSSSPIAAIAGKLSSQSWDRGLTYERVPNLVTLASNDLTKAQLSQLAMAKLNPLIRTTRAKRGRLNEIVLATDNTMAEDGSDFWSVNQVRLIMHVNDAIRALGKRYLGNVGIAQFRMDVEEWMMTLSRAEVLRSFTVNVEALGPREENNYTQSADVHVTVQPFFGLRDIYFTSRVGPGA